MSQTIYALEQTDIAVNIPAGMDISAFTALTLHWIDPDGTEGSAPATASGTGSVYGRGVIVYADVISGDWFFWLRGIAPTGERRGTFGHKLTVEVAGAVK